MRGGGERGEEWIHGFRFRWVNVKGRDEETMEDETSFLGWEKGQASKSILPHAYPRKERARARSKGEV
jgi:hypothetical protein